MKKDRRTTAKILRYTARITLLFFGTLLFLFALVSGSEAYGGGFMGIVKNSPNTIPWVILIALVILSWKWELVSGILITLMGLFALFFFGIFSSNFFLITLFVALVPVVFGGFLIVSWWMMRRRGE